MGVAIAETPLIIENQKSRKIGPRTPIAWGNGLVVEYSNTRNCNRRLLQYWCQNQ